MQEMRGWGAHEKGVQLLYPSQLQHCLAVNAFA